MAEYWLNGKKIGTSDNMFISHEFDVSDMLLFGEENTVTVRLRSVMVEAYENETPMFSLARGRILSMVTITLQPKSIFGAQGITTKPIFTLTRQCIL